MEEVTQLISNKIWSRRSDIREAFIKLDVDGSGAISYAEFDSALKEMKIDITAAQTRAVFQAYECNGNIGFYDLLALVREPKGLRKKKTNATATAQSAIVPETAHTMSKIRQIIIRKIKARHSTLAEAFLDMDDDRSGTVSQSELIEGLAGIGVDLDADDMKILLTTFDADNNGRFSYQEFVSILNDVNPAHSVLTGYGERDDYQQMSIATPAPAAPHKILHDYTKSGTAKDVLKVLTGIVKEKELLLKRLFEKWDKDGSHTIDMNELDNGLDEMGIALSAPALLRLSKLFDVGGKIRYSDFVRVVSEGMADDIHITSDGDRPTCAQELNDGDHAALNHIAEALYDKGRRLKRHFLKFDVKGVGRLSPEDLREGIKTSLKVDISMETIENLVCAFDKDEDGLIRYGEFIQMIGASDIE